MKGHQEMRSSIKIGGRTVGLALVLGVAAMSVATASASAALPEFGFEFPESATYSGGQMVVEGSGNISVMCGTVVGATSWTGWKQFTSALTLKGCSLDFYGIVEKCSSAGAAEGEVVAKSVNTRLEYISKATHEVALVFNSGGKNSTVAAFKCGSSVEAIRGEVIARITPVKVLTAKFTVTFKGAKGVHELTQYENEKGEKIAVSPLELGFEGLFEKASLNSTGLSLQFSKEAEIKA
jgi:hypothetical protein